MGDSKKVAGSGDARADTATVTGSGDRRIISTEAHLKTAPAKIVSEGVVIKVNQAIQNSLELTDQSKPGILDFFNEKAQEILSYPDDLLGFPIPDWLVEYWPTVVNIIRAIINALPIT